MWADTRTSQSEIRSEHMESGSESNSDQAEYRSFQQQGNVVGNYRAWSQEINDSVRKNLILMIKKKANSYTIINNIS